jgi:hypothetical protein
LSTEDEERSGRPTEVTPENVDNITSMVLDVRRISAKQIAHSGDIPWKIRLYYSQDFAHEEVLNQMSLKCDM